MPLPELKQLDVTTPLLQAYQMKMMQGREERDLQRFGMEKERLGLERDRFEASKKTSALDYEKSLVSIGEHYMKAVSDKAGYDEAIGVMVNKYGANPNLFPQVKDDAEAIDTAKRLSMSAVEYQKVLNGDKSTMYKMNPDGTQSKVDVRTKEDVARYTGLGFGFVEQTGKPLGPEIGKTRPVQRGTQEVTEEWTGKKWEEIGSGPKFKPEATDLTTKIGGTKERLIAKKAEGKEWTKDEQEAWELMSKDDQGIAQEVIRLLTKNEEYRYGTAKDKAIIEKKTEQVVRKIYGKEKIEATDVKIPEGASSVDKATGKPIVYRNGKWEYAK